LGLSVRIVRRACRCGLVRVVAGQCGSVRVGAGQCGSLQVGVGWVDVVRCVAGGLCSDQLGWALLGSAHEM
jgi:hypothetical protein